MLLTKNNTASVCPVFESAAGAILYGGIMKLKSHTSDSSFSWIKDSISVSVSDLSSAEIILKFSDFSVTAFSSFSFLAHDPETKEEVSVPFIQLSPDTFRLNLSVFHEFICLKGIIHLFSP